MAPVQVTFAGNCQMCHRPKGTVTNG